jgi:hypothetical protein
MPIRGAMRLSTGAGSFATTPTMPSAPTITAFAIDDLTLDLAQVATFTASFGGGALTGWTLNIDDTGAAEYSGTTGPVSRTHAYTVAGTYTARLIATGPGGMAQATVTGIEVAASAPPPPPPPPPADVRVIGNGNVISDGDSTPSSPDHTIFITAVQSAGGTTRTFTVENTGGSTLTTSGLTVPTGFTVTEGLSANISAGGSDTFTVRLDDATVAPRSGDISFTTNVSGKNPYNFAVSGEVVAAGGETLLMTETRQNQTASTVDKAPVSFVAAFDVGVVPASDTLVLRNAGGTLIPTTHWQWSERSSYSDGSLRSCVISCLSPSMAAGATAGWRVFKTAGARPAETNARTPAHISSVYDINVRLTNTATLNNSGTLQGTRGSGTFRCDANAALASNVTRKEWAGPVRTKWWTWRKFIDETGGASDINLWCEFEVDEWLDPDTGNPVHVHVVPRSRNGWARSTQATYLPVVYQCQLRNGATVVHDYSRSATYTPSDVTSPFIISSQAKLPHGQGSPVRFSGGRPANLVNDRWYATWAFESVNRYTQLRIQAADDWRSGIDAAVICPPLSAATADFTVTTGVSHGVGRTCELVNDDGGEHILLGQPLLYPAWTTAEKRARMDAGLFMPVNLQVQNKQTVDENNIHALGTSTWHRWGLDNTGGGFHIGDTTFWCADALRGMTAARVRRVRLSAAEIGQATFFNRCMSDEIEAATGVEFARITPLNNGPTDTGTSYSGLPPGRPSARIHPGAPSYFTLPGTIGAGDIHAGLSGGTDGTHLSAAHHHDWAMFGTSRYLKTSLEIHTTTVAWWTRNNSATDGGNRPLAGRTYYCVNAIGNGVAVQNARANGQIAHMLSAACYLGDNRPERPYVDHLCRDNFEYMLDALADGTELDALAKRFGWLVSSIHGGGEQHWFNARGQHGCLSLLKRSGFGNAGQRDSIVEWATNWSMIFARASRSGVNFGFSSVPWQYGPGTGVHHFWSTGQFLTRIITAASTNVATEADIGALASSIRFNADNTVTLTINDGAGAATADPANGDQFIHPNEFVWASAIQATSTPPAGSIALRTKYWIYDVVGSGATRTAKISTTPGPSYTQLTWTGSTANRTHVSWTILNNPPKGPSWNPGLPRKYNSDSLGYLPHITAPLACAFRWFGKTDCQAPFAAFLGDPFTDFTGGYATPHGNSGAPQNQPDTQSICDV